MKKSHEINYHPTSYNGSSENDCGVQVLNSFGLSAPHNRLSASQIAKVMMDNGYHVETLYMRAKSSITLKKFLTEIMEPGRNYYLLALLPGRRVAHSMAIVNGKLVDTAFLKKNAKVNIIRRISKNQ